MEILLFEELERGAGAKIQRSYNILSTPLQGLSDSSDEDDCMTPFKNEEGSVCCVCGDTVPFLNKLIEHFKTHTAEVYCHLCRTKFGRVMSLALHLKNAHPQQSFMCEKCGALFKCTWHLNGHIEKHRKDAMQVKPVEIGIKETTRHTDMRKTTLGVHSYCASEQAATNDTCNASQNCIDNDTNSTNQASHIKTETESLPVIDKQNDTFSFSSCPLSQEQEQEHLSFRLKEENDEHRLGESTTCEVAAEEEVGLTEDDESIDTEDEENPDSLPPGDTPHIPEEDFCSDLEDSGSRSSSYDHHRNKKRQKKQTPDRNRPANMNLESVEEGSVCCVCGDTVPFLNKLVEHFKTHTAEVYCHLCRTKFGRVMSLALHLKNAHPQQCFMCEKCGALFKCTWHLNGHIEKHRKDAMQVKPVEIGIKETTRHTDMRKTTLGFHSYCASEQAATNDTCSASQNCIDSDTNSTNQASHIKTETESLPVIDKQNDTFSFSSCPLSQEQEHLSFRLKEENDEHRLGESTTCEVAAEEEVGLTEDDESTDTEDEENPDSLPPGDTPYIPEEDFCSDLEDSDSRSSDGHRRNKKRQKKQTHDRNRPANMNLESVDITKKFGFQSDSPFCCYGKFANLEKHMDDCRNKLRLACCLCNMACENEELLLKHMTEKHPTAGYICAYCYNVFHLQDSFKKHVCLRRPTGGIKLLANPVTQLPVVPLSDSSRQVKPSAPALFTNQNTIKIIKITQTVNKGSTAPDPPPAGSAEALTVHQLLQATPMVPAKVTDLVPQVVAMPQTLIRPHFPQSSCVARPKVPVYIPSVTQPLMPNPAKMSLRIHTPSNPPFPTQVPVHIPSDARRLMPNPARMTLRIPTPSNPPFPAQVPVHIPSVAKPLMPNPARMTLRIPTPSNPPFPAQVPVHIPSVARPLMPNPARMTLRIPTPSNSPFPTQVIVSFSPTANVSAPILVSAHRPVLRQVPPANIRPVNVPVMTSVTCPTLVSALVGNNQPQVPPAQVQAPLQIVAMYVNRSRDLALQKRLEQSWRSKTILPCRHCGAVSRQPSLRVRHRYLHRGSRLYRCQCGRSFQRQLHLLRHQVQHAESVRFVCARCGNTFEGAHKLSCHKRKHRNGRQCAKTKCEAAFDCSCGQMFTRPSALLWHMLKNSKHSKCTRKNSV